MYIDDIFIIIRSDFDIRILITHFGYLKLTELQFLKRKTELQFFRVFQSEKLKFLKSLMLGKNYFEGSAGNNEAKNLRKHYFEKEAYGTT